MIIKFEISLARPDVKDQRRQQILDAFETCVARYGVEGATLAKTAEQAGLARALIRHNVGNREDLVMALTVQYREKSLTNLEQLTAELPDENSTVSLIGRMFDRSRSDSQLVRVANALITASPDDAALAGQMREWLNDYIGAVTRVIVKSHPHASSEQVLAVAAGITGIYFNVVAFYPLGDIAKVSKPSKHAALLLLASLEATS